MGYPRLEAQLRARRQLHMHGPKASSTVANAEYEVKDTEGV